MDDIYSQLDDITQRLDDNDSSQQDFSDSIDQSFEDTQSSIDDLNENSGQLVFPLTQDTIDLITELFPRGTITLSSGTATLIDGRISPNTVIITSLMAISGLGTHVPYYYATPSSGQAVFTSSVSGDASTLRYLLLIN